MNYRSRERVKKIFTHREADRVPYCAVYNSAIQEMVDKSDFEDNQKIFSLKGDFNEVLINPDADASLFKPYFNELPNDVEFSCWGIGRKAQKTQEGWHAGYEMFHPLENVNTIDELKAFPFPDISTSGADNGLEEKVQDLKNQGFTVVGQMSQTILETAYNMRSMPKLMIDFYESPKYIDLLFERIAEQRKYQARRFAEAKVDILRIGDDIAMQDGLIIGPDMYKERIKPYHSSVIQEARTIISDIQVKYHSDGKLTQLLPDLIDIGITIINPVQPECMDLAEIKREFGRDLTLWGCMPVQSIFTTGSRDDVQRHLEFLMKEIAVDGGLIVKFTNVLFTEKSLENIMTFFELFYRMGQY